MLDLNLKKRFSNEVLNSIIEQSAIYTCACPAQVCSQLKRQRELFKFQKNCINQTGIDHEVHETIAKTIMITHRELENCLDKVLRLEGWNMDTYEMPEDLKKKMTEMADNIS